MEAAEAKFRAAWGGKTVKQLQREAKSMRAYMQRHSSAYAWHGKDMTAPGQLADGDKLSILRDLLAERGAAEAA